MCLVTYWIFLATQRDQRQNEDLRQNTVDFKREICQMLIDFPQPPCKICQGWPCDGHQINLRVLRGGGLGGRKNILFEVKEKSTPKRLHAKLYVRVAPNHTPLSPLGGDLRFENGSRGKRVWVNPWVIIAKYATKAATSTLSKPQQKMWKIINSATLWPE